MSEDFEFDKFFEEEETPLASVPEETKGTKEAEPVKESAKPVASPSAESTKQVAVKPSNEISGDDFEIELSGESAKELESVGIEVAKIGKRISKVPIEKYKPSVDRIDRIAFISRQVIPVKTHYIDGVGYIVCFNGSCCEHYKANVRYLFPIAVYQTDSEGNVTGGKVELKILSAGEDLYKNIILLDKQTGPNGGITHIDNLITCTDSKYYRMSINAVGPAIWRKYPEIIQALNDKWKKDGGKAYMAVARKMDEEQFNELMAKHEDSSQASFASEKDLDEFFK